MKSAKKNSKTNLITLNIDGAEIKAQKGEKLLWVALDNGFYIPNLCAIRDTKLPAASCRLCFVEIEGRRNPVTSCNVSVSDGMVVRLNTEKVKRIRNTAFELLLSHHHIDCAHCDKNHNCELQNIAAKLGLKLKLKKFHQIPQELPIDSSHPLFYYNPNRCILCGKCVHICQEKGTGTLDFAFRGIKTIVSTFAGVPLSEACPETCTDSCLACIEICPVGALVKKTDVTSKKAKAGANNF